MDTAVEEFEVLSFKLGEQDMAFDVENVEMVIEAPQITHVPKSKDVIEGIINLRGRIVAVANLSKILDIDIDTDKLKSVIIMKVSDIEIGFLVERVNGVMRVTEDEYDRSVVSEKFGKKSKGLIKKDKNNLVVYLDVNEIVSEIVSTET
ncbi:MAG TPA: purine-binding chemotaxis protein CheW [Thermotoga sp.]|nr:purine-binding chemotaxis protein CheW [Thermotoga sp.]